MTGQDALFGDQGRRVERVEWGNRWPASSRYELRRKGDVDPAASEEHARLRATHPLWGPDGKIFPDVVCRTVVTYTTDWEATS